ncbi:hypothetical protein GCM10029964_082050 [Kibdelosporangium lantanae]
MRLTDHVTIAYTDDGAVLLDERTGGYWQLNATGTGVLRQLLDGRQPAAVADDISTRFGVSAARARADVAKVVADLRSAGLVA